MMGRTKEPGAESEMVQLILSVFRVNGALLIAGDRLTASLGLTSARWQVLGTVVTAPAPMTIAAIARSLGSSRQNVRVLVRELDGAGMVRLAENPQHRRASLVVLTAKGKRVIDSAQALQRPFAHDLGHGISPKRLRNCREVLQLVLERLRVQNERP